MQLSERESELLDAFRRLPPAAANELSALVQRLASLGQDRAIDWSDSWSEDDAREFTAHSLDRLDIEEQGESR